MTRSVIPWRERFPASFPQFENEMENLMERFFGNGEDWALTKFTPSLNLSETDTGFEVTVELPGLKADEVQVELKDNNLWISGEKREEKEEEDDERTFHRIERRHGAFRRMIRLPVTVEPEKVAARFEDGVLTVSVAKSEAVKPKRIPVNS